MLLIRFFYTQIKPTHNNVQAQSLIVPLVTSPARKPLWASLKPKTVYGSQRADHPK